jgi:L-2-amino-thiazoline-4-carboxylic acid hydrolase
MTNCDGAAMHAAFQAASQSRGDLYIEVFRALEKRLGRAEAITAMKEAIHAWGRTLGGGIACHAPRNFEGVLADFALAPDGGEIFGARVDRCDEGGIDVQFEKCPLKTAWVAAGLPEADVTLLCEIAAEADYGTMAAAGFEVDIETWKPGRTGCCMLHIRSQS